MCLRLRPTWGRSRWSPGNRPIWPVRAAWVPHIGPTLGFRVESEGRSVAYVSDHQQPGVGATEVDPAVVELCRDVDVLIHDAQFDDGDRDGRLSTLQALRTLLLERTYLTNLLATVRREESLGEPASS